MFERRLDAVHHKVGPEQCECDQDQSDAFVDAALGQEPPHGSCSEHQDRNRGGNEHQYPLDPTDVYQQQVGVKDEHKRQGHGAQAVEECDETGFDRIAARHGSSGKAGKPDRRGHVSHDAKVEHEQVHRDQWHDQPRLRAQFDHNTRHKR